MIQYLINMDDVDGFIPALNTAKSKSKYILRAAINNSAKEVKKRLERDASKRYALHKGGQGAYREINRIKKATVGNLAAIVEARDGVIDLYKYQVNNRTYYPGGVGAPRQIKARALKKTPYKSLAADAKHKAFVVKFKNGHMAVAERVPGTRMQHKNKEAIRALYAISKPKSEETVFKIGIDKDMHSILMKHIQAQIEQFL